MSRVVQFETKLRFSLTPTLPPPALGLIPPPPTPPSYRQPRQEGSCRTVTHIQCMDGFGDIELVHGGQDDGGCGQEK